MKTTPPVTIDILRSGWALLCLLFLLPAFGCSSPEDDPLSLTAQPNQAETGPFIVRVDNSVSKIETRTGEVPFIVISKVGDAEITDGATTLRANAGAVITLTVAVPDYMVVTNLKVDDTITPRKINSENANLVTYTFNMPAATAIIKGTLMLNMSADGFLDNLDKDGIKDAFDNTLQALDIAQGVLIPAKGGDYPVSPPSGIGDVEPESAFKSDITEYTASVPFSVYPAIVIAAPSNSEATVLITQSTLAGPGQFTVTITVTSLFWKLYPGYTGQLPEGINPNIKQRPIPLSLHVSRETERRP
ncbi:MAG: hypothetical protein LBK66_05770 [Spirochaetaceae bacterium]|jgi:hypothetical protein|nr:hypothetical protein [Spirochaetaceae bacterium]